MYIELYFKLYIDRGEYEVNGKFTTISQFLLYKKILRVHAEAKLVHKR